MKGLSHVEPNPDVKPSMAATIAGPWTTIGTLLGVLAQIGQLGPIIPAVIREYAILIGAVAGLVLQAFFGKPAYVAVPPPPPKTELQLALEKIAELERRLPPAPEGISPK